MTVAQLISKLEEIPGECLVVYRNLKDDSEFFEVDEFEIITVGLEPVKRADTAIFIGWRLVDISQYKASEGTTEKAILLT